jgi:hypothetical protein
MFSNTITKHSDCTVHHPFFLYKINKQGITNGSSSVIPGLECRIRVFSPSFSFHHLHNPISTLLNQKQSASAVLNCSRHSGCNIQTHTYKALIVSCQEDMWNMLYTYWTIWNEETEIFFSFLAVSNSSYSSSWFRNYRWVHQIKLKYIDTRIICFNTLKNLKNITFYSSLFFNSTWSVIVECVEPNVNMLLNTLNTFK